MKTTMTALLLCALGTAAKAQASPQSYAVLAYGSPESEVVFVYSEIDFVCTTQILANLEEIQQQLVAPSLTKIGSGCVTRNKIANLNPPFCTVLDSRVNGVLSEWEYGCYRGVAERILAPPPTAAELAQQREAQKAANVAQQQAAELAAKRLAERTAWQRYAIAWVYQREKTRCLQNQNAHRAPSQDDPAPLCDRSAKNGSAANPTLAVFQYCTYLRSVGQPESTIHAACDTAADKPFNVMPPTIMAPIN